MGAWFTVLKTLPFRSENFSASSSVPEFLPRERLTFEKAEIKTTSGVPKKDTYSPGVERGTTFVYYIILERIFAERDFNRTFRTGDESLA